MEFNLDVAYDRKKTKRENCETIYDQIFQRNIPQHKNISKFLFSIYGTNNIFNQKLNKIRKAGLKAEKTKELGKCSKRKQERPKSSQLKIKNKEEKMLATLVMDKKGKQKKRMVFPNRIAKLIKVF